MLRLLFLVLPGVFLVSLSFAQEVSPEEVCYESMLEEMKEDSFFSSVDLSAVKKINGPDEALVESGAFSVDSYENFLKASKVPVPELQKDIQFYPNRLFNVSPNYIRTLDPIKSNRNLSGILSYQDDIETSIGDIDGDGEDEIINGYYTDTRYVTFGRQNVFMYPPKSRDPNPQSNRDYPGGAPFDDMRQHVIYVQYLAEKFGGDLLSCGIVAINAGEDYVLKAFSEDEREISANLFWGTETQAGDAKYEIVEKDGYKFLKSALRDHFLSRERNEDESRKRLMTYNQLLLSFDSGNDFFNDFEVAEVSRKFMTDPDNLNNQFINIRQNLYEKLMEEKPFGLLQGDGELAIYEGVPISLVQKVESIKDPSVKNMIRSALVPNYGVFFGRFDELDLEDESNTFYRRYMEYPIDYQVRLENIEHIVEQAENVENLDLTKLEYKDMEFGGVVLPVMDARLRKISQTDFVGDEVARLIRERDELIAQVQLKIDQEPSALKKQDMRQEIYKIETEYANKISLIQAFENKFKAIKMDFANTENKLAHGRITEEEYDSARSILFDRFQDYVTEKGIKSILPENVFESLSDNLVNTLKEKEEPEIIEENEDVVLAVREKPSQSEILGYKATGLIFFILAIILCGMGIRVYRNR